VLHILSVWLYSCVIYPACKAHVPYYSNLWPAWLYHIFPHHLMYGTIFGNKVIEHKNVFWSSLQLLSQTLLILRKIQVDIIVKLHRSSCKLSLFWSNFNETWIFSTDSQKILKYHYFMKIRPVGAELFHTDRRTDRHAQVNTRFLQFSERAYERSVMRTKKTPEYPSRR
jgi:hypothetical protein